MYTWVRHAARLSEARGRQQEHLSPEEGSWRLGNRWGGKDTIKAEPSGQTMGVNQGHKRQGPQELLVLPQLCQDSYPTLTPCMSHSPQFPVPFHPHDLIRFS